MKNRKNRKEKQQKQDASHSKKEVIICETAKIVDGHRMIIRGNKIEKTKHIRFFHILNQQKKNQKKNKTQNRNIPKWEILQIRNPQNQKSEILRSEIRNPKIRDQKSIQMLRFNFLQRPLRS